MKISRTIATLASSAAIVAASLFGVAPAQAAEDPAVANARSFLTEFGAPQATQDALIQTYLAGGKWDSLNSSNTPVSTKEYQQDGYDYQVSTYADGSIAVQRVEVSSATGGISARGASGCSVSGKNRNNCTVDMWVGLVAMSFKASYNTSTNTVTNAYGPSWSIGGACSSSLISIGRPAKNIGRMDVSATMCGIPYSTTFFLQVTVKSGKATASWNA